MSNRSFIERVKDEAIKYSKPYQHCFVDYEYIIFSTKFETCPYYILNFQPQNYLHLIGVNSLISPLMFFNKCYAGTLSINDFNFNKSGGISKTKGSVRRKINVLNDLINLFNLELFAEENFRKNNMSCALAASDTKSYTLGMINNDKHKNVLYPMSLMKGNETNTSKICKIDLVLRRPIHGDKYNQIVIGNIKTLVIFLGKIANINLDENLYTVNNMALL